MRDEEERIGGRGDRGGGEEGRRGRRTGKREAGKRKRAGNEEEGRHEEKPLFHIHVKV